MEVTGASAVDNNTIMIQQTIRENEEVTNSNYDDSRRRVELEEERKLMARHPAIQRPGSEFLQKRLQRGQKYFDSGDYNMAKASTNPNVGPAESGTPVTGSKLLNRRQ